MRDPPLPSAAGPSGAAPTGAGGAGQQQQPAVAVYARLASLEQPAPADVAEFWSEPATSFLLTKGARR